MQVRWGDWASAQPNFAIVENSIAVGCFALLIKSYSLLLRACAALAQLFRTMQEKVRMGS